MQPPHPVRGLADEAGKLAKGTSDKFYSYSYDEPMEIGNYDVTVNLGTGKGYSVLDIVKSFEEASGVKIPYVIKPRRPGDIAECYADPSLAYEEMGWKAEYDILDMCRDSWNWQKNNPNGFEE